MRRNPPPIGQLMTRMPHEIDRFETLGRAKEVMVEWGIRHLPVMAGGKLHGIISERDVDTVIAATAGARWHVELADVCTPEPYCVPPTAPVTEVAQEMSKRAIGSAVVVDGGVVVGIFTATDALDALVAAYT
jgi:acetoin utilization protein AcuB